MIGMLERWSERLFGEALETNEHKNPTIGDASKKIGNGRAIWQATRFFTDFA